MARRRYGSNGGVQVYVISINVYMYAQNFLASCVSVANATKSQESKHRLTGENTSPRKLQEIISFM